MVWLLLALGAVSVPLVHEGGHVLAAWLVGGKRLRLEPTGPLSLAVGVDLPEGDVHARRWFYGAGPLANVLACVALAFGSNALDDGTLVVVALALSFLHGVFALMNLMPREGYDGEQLFK